MIKDMVSIVIPTYNGEAFIKECLESIAAQSVPHEVIVVDDMSTDKTAHIAAEMGARVIANDSRKGQVAGKNTGIRNMRGEYFLTIDQDDRLKPNALAVLLDEMSHSGAQIVMARLEDFAESEEDRAFCHREPFFGILTGAAIFKREVFDVIGLFDESIKTGDVIDLTDRCGKCGIAIHRTDSVTCERRIHGGNYGRTNREDEFKDYARLLRRRFLERTGHGDSGKDQ